MDQAQGRNGEYEWLRDDEWKFEFHPLDTPPSVFGRFAAFKALWDNKRSGDRLPAWRDFDLMDFEPWWGWLTVEDIVTTEGYGYDSRYRLFGTQVAELFQADFTGRKMSEIDGFLTPVDVQNGAKMVSERLITVSRGPMRWQDRTYNTYTFVELPLADDGVEIDKVLALLQQV